MSRREVAFTLVLFGAAISVVIGVALIAGAGAACITGGILGAAISWLVLADEPTPSIVVRDGDEIILEDDVDEVDL